MTTFVDASGFYALLDRGDAYHDAASAWLRAQGRAPMMTTNLVVAETCELVRRRLGADAMNTFIDGMLPVIELTVVDERQTLLALASFRVDTSRRAPSMVDRMSFQVMRDQGIREALAFDGHFVDAGMTLVAPKRS